jgi:hypothetical protein
LIFELSALKTVALLWCRNFLVFDDRKLGNKVLKRIPATKISHTPVPFSEATG